MMHELVLFRGTMPVYFTMFDGSRHEQYTHGPQNVQNVCIVHTKFPRIGSMVSHAAGPAASHESKISWAVNEIEIMLAFSREHWLKPQSPSQALRQLAIYSTSWSVSMKSTTFPQTTLA